MPVCMYEDTDIDGMRLPLAGISLSALMGKWRVNYHFEFQWSQVETLIQHMWNDLEDKMCDWSLSLHISLPSWQI